MRSPTGPAAFFSRAPAWVSSSLRVLRFQNHEREGVVWRERIEGAEEEVLVPRVRDWRAGRRELGVAEQVDEVSAGAEERGWLAD